MDLIANLVFGCFYINSSASLVIFSGALGAYAGTVGNWTGRYNKWTNIRLVTDMHNNTSTTGRLRFFHKLDTDKNYVYDKEMQLNLPTYYSNMKALAIGNLFTYPSGSSTIQYDIKNLRIRKLI